MARLGWNHFGVELLARSDEPQPACTETRNDAHPKVHGHAGSTFRGTARKHGHAL